MKVETVKDIIKLFDNVDIMMAYHDMLCGDLLDEGCYRSVYECAYDKTCVVKIESRNEFGNLPDNNTLEWEVWNLVKDMRNEIPKWFAPCVRISENGRILIQKKTTPLTEKEWDELKEVPTIMSDIKLDNFGKYKGHVCMHDYAFTIFRLGISSKMRKISKKDKARR